MTAKELIELLSTLPSDLPVFTAYDSMACVDTPEHIMLIAEGEERGIYICAPSASVDYELTRKETKYEGGKIIWTDTEG